MKKEVAEDEKYEADQCKLWRKYEYEEALMGQKLLGRTFANSVE